MNSISILIYLVNLFSNLGIAAAWVLGISALFFVVTVAIRLIASDDKDELRGNGEIPFFVRLRKWRMHSFWTAVAMVVILAITPSRQTTIMIAASEVAEVVVQSEEVKTFANDVSGIGKDSLSLLKTYIQSEQQAIIDGMKETVDAAKNKAIEKVTETTNEIVK